MSLILDVWRILIRMGEDSCNAVVVLDKKTYKEAFLRYYKPLCLFAQKILSEDEDAEDIVHNVFLALWEKKVSFEDGAHLKSYLFQAVYHQSISFLRHQKFVSRMEDFESEGELDDANYLKKRIETEVFFEVYKAIEQLPAERQKVFRLSYIEGKTISQVAEIMNISEETVRSQRFKARNYLRLVLKDLFVVFLIFHS